MSFQFNFDIDHPYLDHHRVLSQKVLPGTAYLACIKKALSNEGSLQSNFELGDFVWTRPILQTSAPVEIAVSLNRDTSVVQVIHEGEICAQGMVMPKHGPALSPIFKNLYELLNTHFTTIYAGDSLYNKFSSMGIDYGPFFTCIQSAKIIGNRGLAFLNFSSSEVDLVNLIDGAFQSGMALSIEQNKTALMPFSMGRLKVHSELDPNTNQFLVLTRKDSEFRTSLTIFDDQMVPLISVIDLGVKTGDI